MAHEFGVTAWGRAWLRTVERTSASRPNPSLPTARTLARTGAVVLEISSGAVTAEVSARGKTSRVLVSVPLWSRADADAVADLLAPGGAVDRAVSTGELPDSVVTELRERHVSVAVDVADCTATCSCAGRRSPCVHHLAAVYALAGRIDEEPGLAVTVRSAPAVADSSDRSRPAPEWIALNEIDATTFYGD